MNASGAALPSLREYVLVRQSLQRGEGYGRLASGGWEYQDVRQGSLQLLPGATLDLATPYSAACRTERMSRARMRGSTLQRCRDGLGLGPDPNGYGAARRVYGISSGRGLHAEHVGARRGVPQREREHEAMPARRAALVA
jgi:hypothetical protein